MFGQARTAPAVLSPTAAP